MVPAAGLEPARPFGHQHLKLTRLPVPPRGHHRRTLMTVLLWCGRRGSNPHSVSGTSTSRMRVYHFRHDRVPTVRRSGDGAHGEIRTPMGSLPACPEHAAATISPHAHHRLIGTDRVLVRAAGLEPARLSASGLKPEASPSSATPPAGRDRHSIGAGSAGSHHPRPTWCPQEDLNLHAFAGSGF